MEKGKKEFLYLAANLYYTFKGHYAPLSRELLTGIRVGSLFLISYVFSGFYLNNVRTSQSNSDCD